MTSRPTSPLRAAHESVLAIAQTGLALIEVTGSDRAPWLNGLVTCDVMKCDSKRAAYGLVLLRNGRIMADAVVAVDEVGERVLVAVPASLTSPLLAHLAHYLVMEDAEIRAREEGFTAWALHGPRSVHVAEMVRGADVVGGALDRTGLGGALLVVPEPGGERFRVELQQRVLESGGVVGDATDWELLRIERGVARFGVDFDETTYPQEASLETSAVSFDKGCYLGQEVVCMLERRGHVKRRLVPIVIDAGPPPPRGTLVFDAQGTLCGAVTSSASLRAADRSIALAMVKRAHSEPGTRLVIAGTTAAVAAPAITEMSAQ
jgi:hypothetical protein